MGYNSILIILEKKTCGFKRGFFELVNTAKFIANNTGMKIEAVAIGSEPNDSVDEITNHGIDKIYYIESEELKQYNGHLYAPVIFSIIEKVKPEIILAYATNTSKDLIPRISAMIGVPMISNCIALCVSKGKIKATRSLFYGKLFGEFTFEGSPPYVITLAPGFLVPDDINHNCNGAKKTMLETIRYTPPCKPQIELIKVEIHELGKQDISEAEIIVAYGRAIKKSTDTVLLHKLAEKLEAAIGTSRAVVDSGLARENTQIGQTGRSVAPKVYFAIGISGAAQHVAGIRRSKAIIAINKDPEAPIFKYAQYGIIGDLFEIVPEIRKALD